MRDSLIAHGVPENVITLDDQGLRTLNSIVKAKEIYCLDSVTIISQKYHNERALYQADHFGLNAVGYNADSRYYGQTNQKHLARTSCKSQDVY